MKSNRWYTIVCMIIILFSVHWCSDSPEEPQLDTYRSTTSEYWDFYDNYDYSDKGWEECIEPENPYDESTEEWHYAGFERASETGWFCDGNSDSFNEWCEEYYEQEEDYENCLDNR